MSSTSGSLSDRFSEAETRAMNALAAEREAKSSMFTAVGNLLTAITKPLAYALQHQKRDPQ